MPGMIPTPMAAALLVEAAAQQPQEPEEQAPPALPAEVLVELHPPEPSGTALPPADEPLRVVPVLEIGSGEARSAIFRLSNQIAKRLLTEARDPGKPYQIIEHPLDWELLVNSLGRACNHEERDMLQNAVRAQVGIREVDPQPEMSMNWMFIKGKPKREAEPPSQPAAEPAAEPKSSVFVFCCDVPSCSAKTEDDLIPVGWASSSFAPNEFTARLGTEDWINLHFCQKHAHLSELPKIGRSWREQITDLRDEIDNPASKESLGLIPIASSKPLLGEVIRHFRDWEMAWPRLLLVMLGDILDVAQKQAKSPDHIQALLAANGIGLNRITADVRRAAVILARRGHDAESIVAELLKISETRLRALLDSEPWEDPAERYVFREKPGSYLITGAMSDSAPEESPPPAEPTGDDDAPDPQDQSAMLFVQRFRAQRSSSSYVNGEALYEEFRRLGADLAMPEFADLPLRVCKAWGALADQLLDGMLTDAQEPASGRRSDLQLAQAEVNELSSKLAAAEHEIAELRSARDAKSHPSKTPSAEEIAAVLQLGLQIAPGETSPFVKGLKGKSISDAAGLLIQQVRAFEEETAETEKKLAGLRAIMPGGEKGPISAVIDRAIGELVDGEALLGAFDDLLWRASRRWLPGTLLDEALDLHDRYVQHLGGGRPGAPKVIATNYRGDGARQKKTPQARPVEETGLEVESVADLDWFDRLKVLLSGQVRHRTTIRTEQAPGRVLSEKHRFYAPLFRARRDDD